MTVTTTPSPITYFGGKSRIADQIVDLFPSHTHYVEVCGGGLSVLLAKPPSRQETVNDLDESLITFWRVLRDRHDDLERVVTLTPHSRAERELAWTITDDLDELEVARRVAVALTQGRAGSRTSTGWRYDAGPATPSMPIRLRRYAGRIAPAAARLADVSLENRPAVDLVRAYGVHRTSLLYVDPPYDVDRSSSYAVDMTGADHAELIDAVLAADAAVVVSGYAGGLWDHRLTDAGWYRHEITAATSQSGALQQRTEVVWSNRVSSHGAPVRDETQAAPTRCPACTAIIRQPRTGRRRRWCSVACRNVGYRAQRD